MKLRRRAWLACLLVGLVPAGQADDAKSTSKAPAPKAAAPAAAAKPAATLEADDELLEFLGSVDSDTGDEDWLEFLSQTDIGNAARKSPSAKSGPTAAPEVREDD